MTAPAHFYFASLIRAADLVVTRLNLALAPLVADAGHRREPAGRRDATILPSGSGCGRFMNQF